MPLQRGITEVQNGGTPDNGRTLRQLGYKDADRRAETRQADRAVVIKGAMDGPAFTAYIREVLIPEIVPGAVVILDDLATHRNKEAAQSLRDHGCWFLYLPPYSPDLNPIERAFSTLRAHLRRIGARTFKEVFEAICVVWFS
ncbi:transposase [Shimia sp.]|uniref:transposase n=1 Tax=Shimia sp. TaxID=1954381 RepID=UPI003BACFB1B